MKRASLYVSAVMLLASVTYGQTAGEMLRQAGVAGGFVVHLGCGDGRLTAALRENESFLVHGLDEDADAVGEARAYLDSLGLYGAVSVDRFDGEDLPYIDNVVNALVAEQLGGVLRDEIMRVLAPEGVA